MIKWEKLDGVDIVRAKIPGGWLVRVWTGDAASVTFVPDPQHKWDGNSLP